MARVSPSIIPMPEKRKRKTSRKTATKAASKKAPAAKKKAKKKSGRPAYTPTDDHKETAYLCARQGLNEEEIAETVGISYATFRRNKEHFRAPIEKGRSESADVVKPKIENALVRNACGYSVTDETTDIEIGAGTVNVRIKQTKKHWAPNTTAAMFWLVNKFATEWQSINRPGAMPEEGKGDIIKWLEAIPTPEQAKAAAAKDAE